MFRFDSPLGIISYAWDGQQCQRVCMHAIGRLSISQDDPVSQWLSAYFENKSVPLPALVNTKTPFQIMLRLALQKIPRGERLTYGELAKRLNSSPRAVGQALGANPLPILVPCHRVVGAKSLGGFAYGAEWKKALLEFEQDL